MSDYKVRSTFKLTGKARRLSGRRAFSLFELLSAVAIIGLVSGLAIMRLGDGIFHSPRAEGFARHLALDLGQARRRAISTGDDHYVLFNRTAGTIVSYDVIHDDSGGAYPVQSSVVVPDDITVSADNDQWTYEFSGTLTIANPNYTIRIDGAEFFWNVNAFPAAGAVSVDKFPQP